ncbi:MAG: serine hydroxymethyltransferase, partial [Thermoprotei archaeon]
EVFKIKPKLVILGASSILFPYNLKRVREICDRVDAYIGYDASHVLGLIAGKMFQPDPFKNGVDILFGSTHKTFFGPQGGMILTDNDDIAEKILRNMKLKMLDNPHLNRIAGLVQALWEFLMYGEKYARQVVYNAKALGKYLDANNIPVKYGELGYTESHQILLDIEKIEEKSGLKYSQIARKMEEANIIIDLGGRIGTQEISRIGMKEKDMKLIANLFSEIVIEKKSIDIVRKKVLNIRGKFTKICYC